MSYLDNVEFQSCEEDGRVITSQWGSDVEDQLEEQSSQVNLLNFKHMNNTTAKRSFFCVKF